MKIGDRVIITTTNKKFMEQWQARADSGVGIIVALTDGISPYWYMVQFPNGYNNHYPEHAMELIGPRPIDAAEYEEIMAAQALMEGAK